MKIGVFIPIYFPGGTLRLGKNIAKMLNRSLGEFSKTPVQVVFGNPESKYSNDELQDLVAEKIEIRHFNWKRISRSEAEESCRHHGLACDLKMNQYVIPTDGKTDFQDLDYWLFITDRIFDIFIPIKRSGIIATDYIQRYVPEIFDILDQQHPQAVPHRFIRNTRNVSDTFALTPGTLDDLKVFVGRMDSTLLPLVVDDDFIQNELLKSTDPIQKQKQFIWATNTTQHKNHENTLKGLLKYYENGGDLDCVVTGVNTDVFDVKWNSHPDGEGHLAYQKHIRNIIASLDVLRSRIKVLGNISDADYVRELRKSQFILHSVIADNGTFSVIEAARLGTPAVSSRYPQQEYLCELFGVNPLFFNPLDSTDLSEKLLSATKNNSLIKFDTDKLAQRLWKNKATEFCQNFITVANSNRDSRTVYG